MIVVRPAPSDDEAAAIAAVLLAVVPHRDASRDARLATSRWKVAARDYAEVSPF